MNCIPGKQSLNSIVEILTFVYKFFVYTECAFRTIPDMRSRRACVGTGLSIKRLTSAVGRDTPWLKFLPGWSTGSFAAVTFPLGDYWGAKDLHRVPFVASFKRDRPFPGHALRTLDPIRSRSSGILQWSPFLFDWDTHRINCARWVFESIGRWNSRSFLSNLRS